MIALRTARWISKGEWFDRGTEAHLIFPITDECGLFIGIKNGEEDEESCCFDEFYILGHFSE